MPGGAHYEGVGIVPGKRPANPGPMRRAGKPGAVLGEGDETRIKQVRSYARSHKNRAGVLEAAERQRSNA